MITWKTDFPSIFITTQPQKCAFFNMTTSKLRIQSVCAITVYVWRIRFSIPLCTSMCSAISFTCVSFSDICTVQRTVDFWLPTYLLHPPFKIQTTLNVGSSDLCTLTHVGRLSNGSRGEAGSFGNNRFSLLLIMVCMECFQMQQLQHWYDAPHFSRINMSKA